MTAHDAPVSSVPAPALRAFAERFRGRLFGPGDEGYDEARSIWNGAIDRRPGLVARCSDADDVVSAVRFAREHDLRMSVRGGGHGVGGLALCDDGLVVDLSEMKGVRVDPDAGLAEVGAGVTLGELDRATQAFGLAVPAGIVTHTGVAGLTLGGGIGWLTRKHGLTIDNLVGADVVTADGELVAASEDDHADLFWGLRGGGGNFGVVTSFRFRAHPDRPDRARGADALPARTWPRGHGDLPDVGGRGARRAHDGPERPPRAAGAVDTRTAARRPGLDRRRVLVRSDSTTGRRSSRRCGRSGRSSTSARRSRGSSTRRCSTPR